MNDVGLSHKEAIHPLFTSVWQAGDGPSNKTRRYPKWDFAHAVVFVYSPTSVRLGLSGALPLPSGDQFALRAEAETLTHTTLSSRKYANAAVMLGRLKGATLEVDQWWHRSARDEMSVHEVRAALNPSRHRKSGYDYCPLPPVFGNPASILTSFMNQCASKPANLLRLQVYTFSTSIRCRASPWSPTTRHIIQPEELWPR